jgi:hypothetical protein
MPGINGVMVVFKGVYGCVTVALVRKLREFYDCVTVVHLRHTLVRRIWTTHFSILIRSPPFRGHLSALGWTAFGMPGAISFLEMTLFSLHRRYVVPFAILETLKHLAFLTSRGGSRNLIQGGYLLISNKTTNQPQRIN